MEIIGAHNARAKAAAELKQKKFRQERGLFLAEGLRAVEEAVRARAAASVFYTPIEDERVRMVLEQAAAANSELFCTDERLLKKIADTQTPQGIVAVCKARETALEELLAGGRMLLALDRVADPGNVGTILRTADAAGIGGVVLLEGCADVYAPKTVRSAMGSHFHVKLASGVPEAAFLRAARQAGYEILATCLKDGRDLYRTELRGRLAFVMGSEAGGASESILRAADKKVYIPMPGRAESLNVAMAAGIVLFEALRQQRRRR